MQDGAYFKFIAIRIAEIELPKPAMYNKAVDLNL